MYKGSWLLIFSHYFAGGSAGGSATQKAYFVKTNIIELKIGLNYEGISLSHSPEVRWMPSMMVESIDC